MKKWNEFTKLQTNEDLCEYFENREYTHGKYCHYTKISSIEKILEKHSFRLSCVSGFNDECDKLQFGNEQEQKYFYSLCFTTGETENLALWYLYSGMSGEGGRLSFTEARIKNLVENSIYELVEIDNNSKQPIGKGMVLEEDNTMKKDFQDVVYYQIQKEAVRLKYNTMTNNDKISLVEFEKYMKTKKGIFKNLIWYYEKETRLVIELKGEARNVIDVNKDYAIIMHFPNDFSDKWINIRFAPEVDENKYWDIINKNKSICNFLKFTSNLSRSEHSGEVKMKLCDKCEYRCIEACIKRDKGKT